MNPLAVVDVEADDAELGNSERLLHGSHLPKPNKLSKRPPLVERRHTCDARRRHVDRHESQSPPLTNIPTEQVPLSTVFGFKLLFWGPSESSGQKWRGQERDHFQDVPLAVGVGDQAAICRS